MGKLIVIDGLDGSGKETQAKLTCEKLRDLGHNAHLISFPAYESDSSAAVRMYLNGEIGDNPDDLSPYVCSTFYSVDRVIQYEKHLKNLLEQKDSIVIADRYISANVIHQGGKLKGYEERKEFFKWLYDFEVETLGLPKDDITIILDVPVWKSQELMNKRYSKEGKKDIHESKIEYLERCYGNTMDAIEIMNILGYSWTKINCLQGNKLKSIESINNSIMKLIKHII